MIRKQLTILNKSGLHTRPAAKLVDIAKKYSSKIEITFRNRTVDAKSIMGLITLGLQKDHVIDLTITGDDEEEAASAIAEWINQKCGED